MKRGIFLANIAAVALFACPVFAAETADAQCNISATALTQDVCATPAVGDLTNIGSMDHFATRSDPGLAITAIDVWYICRYVDNNSTDTSIFVPFKTAFEWQSFLDNAPAYINLATCARPGVVPVPSDFPIWPDGNVNIWYNDSLSCDRALQNDTNHSYARTGAQSTASTTFTCTVAGLCDPIDPSNCGADQQWTQTAAATFAAGVAPDYQISLTSGGWGLTSVIYTGTKPPPNPPAARNGVCGAANGTIAIIAPTSGFCNVGAQTPVAGTGPWTWSCLGSSGGTDASCSVSLPVVAGTCGPDNGVAVASAPTSGLCTTGNPTAVAGTGPWTWTCLGAGGGADAPCSAPSTAVAVCIPTGQPVPAGQTACPTDSCFFWVSGLSLATFNDFAFPNMVTKIGDTSLTWNTSLGLSGSNGVGAGDYPDSYGSSGNPGPFYLAANGTFDGIAIGRATRLIVYQGTNFSGPVLFDQHGPMVVNNRAIDMSDWSALGGIFAQFPPSTRFLSNQFGLSNAPNTLMFGFGPWNLWVLSGLPAPSGGFGYGATSIKVICD